MSEKLLIRPGVGKKIKNPLNGLVLPADRNTAVYATQFWLRRLQCGDVVKGPVEKKAEPSVEKEKKVSRKKMSASEESSE